MKALSLVLVAALLACASAGGPDVITATAENWASTIAPLDVVLVEFFAPWCGHCKTLAPKYDAAATQLKGVAHLAAVDCTAEGDLCGQYGVRGYPTLKVFRNNVPTDYAGAREIDAIVRYMKKQKQPAVTEVGADGFEEFTKSDKVVVVAFMGTDNEHYDEFQNVAETHRNDFTFGVVSDAKVAEANGVTAPAIILFKAFDEGKNVYSGDFSIKSIASFVKTNSVPTMDDIGPENYASYAESGLPLAYLFVNNKEQRASVGLQVEAVAKEFKGKVNFVYIDAAKFGGHASNLNLKQEWPAFAIQRPQQNLKFPYDQSKAITTEGIREFVQAFVDGKVSPSVKSEEVPASQDGPVTVVVGKQFEEIVNQAKDVLIEFYAPWCGHCKKLAPVYDELGEKLKPFSDHVVIAKMDATANDLPVNTPYQVNGFPTIKLVKADNTVVDYNGDRSLDDFVKFLQQNAVNGKKIVLGNASTEKAAGHDHDHAHDEL